MRYPLPADQGVSCHGFVEGQTAGLLKAYGDHYNAFGGLLRLSIGDGNRFYNRYFSYVAGTSVAASSLGTDIYRTFSVFFMSWIHRSVWQ